MLILTKALFKRRVYRRSSTLKILQVRWSRRLFRKELAANVVANGLMLGTGDVILQEIEKHRALTSKPKKCCDWFRTVRMIAVGAIQGMPLHVFYRKLEFYLPGRDFRSITLKTMLDQLIASPMSITIFFLGMGILERKNLGDEFRELRSKFWRVYSVDCMIWPAAQAINFKYVPLPHRVFFVSVVTIIFSIFLSYAHYDMPEMQDSTLEMDQSLQNVPQEGNNGRLKFLSR